MASSIAAEFMYVCRRRLWMAEAWGNFSKDAWAILSSCAVGVRKRPVSGIEGTVVCVVSGEAMLLCLRFFDGGAVVWLCVGGLLSVT